MLIDQFTKKLYATPCNSKNAYDVLDAFKEIFQYQKMSRPSILYRDNGGEFTNKQVYNCIQNALHIKHVTTKDVDIKCAIVERANRTLKSVIVRHAHVNNG